MQLLVKSLAVLRAELHRLRVATMTNVRAELERRSVHKSQVRDLFDKNPEWRTTAGPVQRQRLMDAMSAGGKDELQEWSQQLCHDARYNMFFRSPRYGTAFEIATPTIKRFLR